jgi:hypothetical protein
MRSALHTHNFYLKKSFSNLALHNRLNMELDLTSLFALLYVQLYSLAETPQPLPSPRIWAHIRGRYWSAKIDDISL